MFGAVRFRVGLGTRLEVEREHEDTAVVLSVVLVGGTRRKKQGMFRALYLHKGHMWEPPL